MNKVILTEIEIIKKRIKQILELKKWMRQKTVV